VVDSYSASIFLDGLLDPATTRGKIVVCDCNVNSRAAKGDVVRHAGAAWMVMANNALKGVVVGDKLCKYITSSNKEDAQDTPAAHQTIGLATLGGTPLRSRGKALHRYNFASLEDRSPPRVKFRLARGSDAPSSGISPRSGAGRPLTRGPVSIESRAPPRVSFRLARGHHRPAASTPAPPAGAFNTLTFAGAQVKGESTPLHAWESRPGTAPPTPVARPSPPLCDAVRHGQQQPRGTMPPTPVRPARRTLEKGRRSPRKENEQLRHVHARTTSRRWASGIDHLRRHRPRATIPAVPDAIPATASPSPTL
jgi:hypothetical protein